MALGLLPAGEATSGSSAPSSRFPGGAVVAGSAWPPLWLYRTNNSNYPGELGERHVSMRSPTYPPCAAAAREPAQASHRYTARGERVDPAGGVYWIPARDFAHVVETARRDPAVLNRYPVKRL